MDKIQDQENKLWQLADELRGEHRLSLFLLLEKATERGFQISDELIASFAQRFSGETTIIPPPPWLLEFIN